MWHQELLYTYCIILAVYKKELKFSYSRIIFVSQKAAESYMTLMPFDVMLSIYYCIIHLPSTAECLIYSSEVVLTYWKISTQYRSS